MALPKTGSRIPIGPGDDIPGSVSIDISEASSLADELLGKNQPFEAMEGCAGPEGYFLQEHQQYHLRQHQQELIAPLMVFQQLLAVP